MPAAYLFQAKGIQRFILEGGKLKDIVGASELIDGICRWQENDLVSEVLKVTGLTEGSDLQIARRAGGTLFLVGDDRTKLERFRNVWSLVVSQHAPGLEYSHVVCEAEDEISVMRAAYGAPESRHNAYSHQLPLAGPLVKRSGRTGLAAVDQEPVSQELLDVATKQKRDFSDSTVLGERFSPDDGLARVWPINMDAEDGRDDGGQRFPFRGDNRWVGIVHVDGNRLGEAIRTLNQRIEANVGKASAVDLYRRFSQAIDRATVMAAQAATKEVLDGAQWGATMPARPIVLGGDDLTIIVRGDLAIPFAKIFLQNFEKFSEEQLQHLTIGGNPVLTESKMTAAAGIAFTKANQPYYLAYRLAGGLCDLAKEKSQQESASTPSSLAFHRVTTSYISDVPSIVANDTVQLEDGSEVVLSQQPYQVGGQGPHQLSSLEDLERLKVWLAHEGVARGPLRELKTLVTIDPAGAKRGYRRWCQNVASANGGLWSDYKAVISDLLGASLDDPELPFNNSTTPIFDAMEWLAVEVSE